MKKVIISTHRAMPYMLAVHPQFARAQWMRITDALTGEYLSFADADGGIVTILSRTIKHDWTQIQTRAYRRLWAVLYSEFPHLYNRPGSFPPDLVKEFGQELVRDLCVEIERKERRG